MLPFLQGNVLRKRRRVFVFQPTTSSLKLFCLVFDVFPGKKCNSVHQHIPPLSPQLFNQGPAAFCSDADETVRWELSPL